MNWEKHDQLLPIEMPDPWDRKIAEMRQKDIDFIRAMEQEQVRDL